MSAVMTENSFTDLHGREVSAFGMEIANVGFHRMARLLLSMLESGSWQKFTFGHGTFRFLPGEFDYFLSLMDVKREDVMKIPDVEAKAKIASAMDERETGTADIRRPALQARAENPDWPGRTIEPYGLTRKEAKSLVRDVSAPRSNRPALGERVRRYAKEGQTKRPSEIKQLPLAERLRQSAARLSDADLDTLIEALKQDRKRRRQT